MTQRLLLACGFAAISAAIAALPMVFPSAQSRSDAPTCTVRSSQSVAPPTKASSFTGGDAPTTSTVAATVAAAC